MESKAVTKFVQQVGDLLPSDLKSLTLQFGGEASHAFARPSQGRYGVAPRGWLDQGVQGFFKSRLCGGQSLATSATPTDPLLGERGDRVGQLAQSDVNGAPRNACRPSHHRNATVSQFLGLRSGPYPPLPFVQRVFHIGKPLPYSHFHAFSSHGRWLTIFTSKL